MLSYDSLSYVLCCNINCHESGNIKKNLIKCNNCKNILEKLSLSVLNKYFCPYGIYCESLQYNTVKKQKSKCKLLHPNKKHISPPFISPCHNGVHCDILQCIYLHPDKDCISWQVRI